MKTSKGNAFIDDQEIICVDDQCSSGHLKAGARYKVRTCERLHIGKFTVEVVSLNEPETWAGSEPGEVDGWCASRFLPWRNDVNQNNSTKGSFVEI